MACTYKHNDFFLYCAGPYKSNTVSLKVVARIFLYVSSWDSTAFLPLPETIYFLKMSRVFLNLFFTLVHREEQFSRSIVNFNTKQLKMLSVVDSKHMIYSNTKVIVWFIINAPPALIAGLYQDPLMSLPR